MDKGIYWGSGRRGASDTWMVREVQYVPDRLDV
jgi:hypothetical protein